MLQNLVQVALNTADTVMIGRLGELQLAAVGAGNQMFNVYCSLLFGFFSGAGVYVAQYYGAKDLKHIRRIVGFDLMLGTVLTVLTTVFAQLYPDKVIGIFADDPAVIEDGAVYLRIVSLSYLFTAWSFALGFNSRAVQRPKGPATIDCLALGLNVVLNYLLIYGPGPFPALGVKGAAIATLIARIFEFLAMVIYIAMLKDHPFHGDLRQMFDWDGELFKNVMKKGVPVTLSEGGFSLGSSLTFACYGMLGASALAVVQVAGMACQIFQSVIFGFGSGAGVVIGEVIGMREVEIAEDYCKRVLKIAGVMIAIMVAGILLIMKPIGLIYGFGAETTGLLYSALSVYAFMMIPRMTSYIVQCGVLRSGGDTFFCMIIEVVSNLGLEPALAYTAVALLGWPLPMCIALAALAYVFKAAAFLIRYKSRKWLNVLV